MDGGELGFEERQKLKARRTNQAMLAKIPT
jgi:hypothetical protein